MQVITPEGKQMLKVNLPEAPHHVCPSGDGRIYIAFQDRIMVCDVDGRVLENWDALGKNTVITALALKGGLLFVADAGNRRIVKCDAATGSVLGEFEGKTSFESLHGFIVPSPAFDLGVNSEGELWVVNPGKHSLENYTDDGELRTFWENSSQDIYGFTGCCNPAHLALLPDGSFVTKNQDTQTFRRIGRRRGAAGKIRGRRYGPRHRRIARRYCLRPGHRPENDPDI
jgi:DNA-binding beta-propeller fold protein YncE